jgi:hypothetical protein
MGQAGRQDVTGGFGSGAARLGWWWLEHWLKFVAAANGRFSAQHVRALCAACGDGLEPDAPAAR